jgi:hypothetical protein
LRLRRLGNVIIIIVEYLPISTCVGRPKITFRVPVEWSERSGASRGYFIPHIGVEGLENSAKAVNITENR